MKTDFVFVSLHAIIRLFILKDVKQENEISILSLDKMNV
ncbi:hypothetical protein LEP1GSC060_2453 [Leptospira weilii serovar Ranarum str. ICFT]|uniref:Uncharacterized protein n=1 Tax=Leptospira weilii serovar Ranarum str. ICFT TaxID=1218598 RepID=N1WGQ0_9LEPT|nr:hypothetical protein LEP1GSC060_2453 [Leptospira weilii serovar Ranarum str. ICFT]